MELEKKKSVGRVIVLGGGIGGIQCALDLADAGFHVSLVEKTHTLGGTMAALDKTFPTNDCSTCMFSPKLAQAARHEQITIMTRSRLLDLEGEAGNFTARIEKRPRYIDEIKCIACGQCAEKCPKKVPDPFNQELSRRKAAFLTFPQAVPLKYALDPEHCLYLTKKRCGLCKKICPTQAVDFDQQSEIVTIQAGAVVISTGFELALTKMQGEFGYGRYPNVVTSLQFERMLSATGPYGGHLKRPSDEKIPQKVAWIQCVMSRDASRNRPFCSSVCCMHATKQAILTRIHSAETEAVIYFMDIRAQGKGFDSYVERARSQHGVRYKRSMISQVYHNPQSGGLIIETFDHDQNRKIEEEYDLVVLSSGFKPHEDFLDLARRLGLRTNRFGFLTTPFDNPAATSRPGVFVCGAVEAPKDIPETVIQAGAAAAEASALMAGRRDVPAGKTASFDEEVMKGPARVGVFVCHCGTNIAGVVDIPRVLEQVKKLPHVVFSTSFLFSCASETLQSIVELIREHRLNRVVVAACSPKTHEPLFQSALVAAGLNPYLFELVSIRDQCSWVHGNEPQKATLKSMNLIRAGVARAVLLEPLTESTYEIVKEGLVVGGGIAGLTAALSIADQGFPVHLVEKDGRLGGHALELTETVEGDSPEILLRHMIERVTHHPRISVYLQSRLAEHKGHAGAFEGLLESVRGTKTIRYGVVVAATGAQPYEPDEYLYGKDPRVLTQVELAKKLADDPSWAQGIHRVAMIQCVGSRNEAFPACSRVCCSGAVKNSLTLKQVNPDSQVLVLYRDMRTFGFKELHYLEARRKGVMFFRYIPEESPEVFKNDERLVVDFTDRSSHQAFRFEPDLLVLSSGMRPHQGAEDLARVLKLPRTEEGFFLEAHVKLRPVEFDSQGIFLAGTAHSPRFISESVTMAKSAAQQAVKILCREKMQTLAAVAEVDPEKCTACLACVRECPFSVPVINEEGVSEISSTGCRGCGVCTAVCPRRAISLKHSKDDQINAKIDALLEPGELAA